MCVCVWVCVCVCVWVCVCVCVCVGGETGFAGLSVKTTGHPYVYRKLPQAVV